MWHQGCSQAADGRQRAQGLHLHPAFTAPLLVPDGGRTRGCSSCGATLGSSRGTTGQCGCRAWEAQTGGCAWDSQRDFVEKGHCSCPEGRGQGEAGPWGWACNGHNTKVPGGVGSGGHHHASSKRVSGGGHRSHALGLQDDVGPSRPQPCPRPRPQPCPRSGPQPCPRPRPQPCPWPRPQPCPRSCPQPCPCPILPAVQELALFIPLPAPGASPSSQVGRRCPVSAARKALSSGFQVRRVSSLQELTVCPWG